jgi:hypothetical protein
MIGMATAAAGASRASVSAAHSATPDCLLILRRRSGCSATGGEAVVSDLVIFDLSLVFEEGALMRTWRRRLHAVATPRSHCER